MTSRKSSSYFIIQSPVYILHWIIFQNINQFRKKTGQWEGHETSSVGGTDEMLVSPSNNGPRKINLPNLSSVLFQWRVVTQVTTPWKQRILVPLSRLTRIWSIASEVMGWWQWEYSNRRQCMLYGMKGNCATRVRLFLTFICVRWKVK